MRYAALITVVLLACDGGNSTPPPPDAPRSVDARIVDSQMIDAAVDAPPATDPAITMACTDLCDAIGVCAMQAPDASCVTDCSGDLADCTAQQVTDLDACKTEACGDENNSPLINCILGISCVDD